MKTFFAKTGFRDAMTDLNISFTLADSDLVGNGLAPRSFLNQSTKQIFTKPDMTIAQMAIFNATGSHWLHRGATRR